MFLWEFNRYRYIIYTIVIRVLFHICCMKVFGIILILSIRVMLNSLSNGVLIGNLTICVVLLFGILGTGMSNKNLLLLLLYCYEVVRVFLKVGKRLGFCCTFNCVFLWK
jgi:hypothetical protein